MLQISNLPNGCNYPGKPVRYILLSMSNWEEYYQHSILLLNNVTKFNQFSLLYVIKITMSSEEKINISREIYDQVTDNWKCWKAKWDAL